MGKPGSHRQTAGPWRIGRPLARAAGAPTLDPDPGAPPEPPAADPAATDPAATDPAAAAAEAPPACPPHGFLLLRFLPLRSLPARRWAVCLLLAAALLAALLGIWQRSQSTARRQRLAADTVPVLRQDIQLRVKAAGVIRPTTPVNISPKRPGRLVALLVDQGQRVAAGQVLARMDASDLEGEEQQARGSLAAAEATLRRLRAGNRPQEIQQAHDDLAQAEADLIAVRSAYQSDQRLYGSGAISRLAADTSRSRYRATLARIEGLRARLDLLRAGARPEDIAVAEAGVEQARGALATIRSQLDDCVIRAPFAGVVTQKYADVGAFVTPTTSASATSSATSSSILALAGALEGVANVAEADVAALRAGQPVELRLDAYPGRRFPATVRLVAPEAVIEQNVTSFQVRIAPAPALAGLLRSGMNFTASFRVGGRQGALLIPTGAIVSEAGRMGVNLALPSGDSRFVPVRVGATVGSRSEVLAGLRAGDRVYTTFPGRRPPSDRPVRSGSPFTPARPGARLPR